MIFQSAFFIWGLAVIIAIPLLIIILNEVIDRLRRSESQYAEIFALVRDVVLPLLATLIVLRLVFVVEETDLATRIISTIFWSLLVLVVFRFTRAIIGSGEYEDEDWRSLIPHMFLRLPPYTLMGYVVYHVIQNVWALPLQEMATTLGIGSIVIAFALQDTLSNLVSGLLLVANSPFKPGEWIKVGDAEGKVLSVNWRYTSIETWNSDLIVIPNGAISQESIENFSRPTPNTVVAQEFEISFAHPPNLVKDALLQTMRATPEILSDPPPAVFVTNISDPAMGYTVEFWIDDYGSKPDVHDAFMTRAWYALQRSELALPTPIYEIQTHKGATVNDQFEIAAEMRTNRLTKLSAFSSLPPDAMRMLGEKSAYRPYAASEKILDIGMREAGLYMVLSGIVNLSMYDDDGEERLIDTLKTGGIFGETGLFNRPISPIMVTVMEDAEILVIPHEVMSGIINRHGQFADGINALINQRRIVEDRIAHRMQTISSDDFIPYLQHMGQNSRSTAGDSTPQNAIDLGDSNALS